MGRVWGPSGALLVVRGGGVMTVAGNREEGEERGLARVHFDSISRSLEAQEADSYVHVEPSPIGSSPFPPSLLQRERGFG